MLPTCRIRPKIHADQIFMPVRHSSRTLVQIASRPRIRALMSHRRAVLPSNLHYRRTPESAISSLSRPYLRSPSPRDLRPRPAAFFETHGGYYGFPPSVPQMAGIFYGLGPKIKDGRSRPTGGEHRDLLTGRRHSLSLTPTADRFTRHVHDPDLSTASKRAPSKQTRYGNLEEPSGAARRPLGNGNFGVTNVDTATRLEVNRRLRVYAFISPRASDVEVRL